MPVDRESALPAFGHLPPHTAHGLRVLASRPKVEDRDALPLRVLATGHCQEAPTIRYAALFFQYSSAVPVRPPGPAVTASFRRASISSAE